jgi:thymidylate synthase
MNEYISTAQFARSREKITPYKEMIKECVNVFNERSKTSSNYKKIKEINFLSDYSLEIRWVSANPIDILQAGRALRLFSDELLGKEGMREKVVGNRFLSYQTVLAQDSSSINNLDLLEKLIHLIKNSPNDPKLSEIKKILF